MRVGYTSAYTGYVDSLDIFCLIPKCIVITVESASPSTARDQCQPYTTAGYAVHQVFTRISRKKTVWHLPYTNWSTCELIQCAAAASAVDPDIVVLYITRPAIARLLIGRHWLDHQRKKDLTCYIVLLLSWWDDLLGSLNFHNRYSGCHVYN